MNNTNGNLKATWKSMTTRCYNSNRKEYKYYGGIGIKVCKRWLDSFHSFQKDMGDKPSEDYCLTRIDMTKDFTPENCIWAPRSFVNKNKRQRNIGIKAINPDTGETLKFKSITEASTATGIAGGNISMASRQAHYRKMVNGKERIYKSKSAGGFKWMTS